MFENETIDTDIVQSYSEKTGSPYIDSLTGLVNHGFFLLTLEREIQRCQRYGGTFTLGLVGIDAFKQYNDDHGRIEGDRLLKTIGKKIEKNIRKVDLAGRYIGDIFSILFTEVQAEDILNAAERICISVKALNENSTVSIGLATYSNEYSNIDELFLKTQDALIKSKLKGKNRITIFQNSISPLPEEKPKVLIVDDDLTNRTMLQAMLTPLNYDVLKAENGIKALEIMKKMEVDLVLLDLMMPEMDGFETCRRIKSNPKTQMIPVILITCLDDMESKVKGIEVGADDFLTKPASRVELIARTKSLIKQRFLVSSLINIETVLFSLARAVEAKDAYTQGHTERVANLSLILGGKMGLSERDMKALTFGGVMHDIGKIGIPNQIINKPGKLDPEEWQVMKKHPAIGYEIALPLEKNLGPALQAIRYHHEKMDGSGYPDGLKGEEIPVIARIVGLADIYDALTTDRPYRKGLSKEKAVKIMQEEAAAGKLDTAILDKFIGYITNVSKEIDLPFNNLHPQV